MRRDISRLKRKRYGETGKKGMRKFKEVNAKYIVKKKKINLITEELKQRLIAKKRYIQKVILTEYILARKWEEGD